jgi:hypothetical protein
MSLPLGEYRTLTAALFVEPGTVKPLPQQDGGDVSGGGDHGEREAAAPAHSRG